jgi:hypothetical protein
MGVQTVQAQNYNTIFQQYLATTNGEILTIVNENNIQFDEQKNIYSMVDKEPIRASILTKVSNTGNLLWVDTLKVSNYSSSAIGYFQQLNHKVYSFATYGNNLNSSIAEACAILVHNENGTKVNQKIISNANTNYFARNIQLQKNKNLIIEYITNNANQNWTLHVDCLDSNLNVKWTQSFAWPGYSPTAIASEVDLLSNTYLSYTTDSMDAGNYYRKAFVHKIDATGNVQWTTTKWSKRYNLLKIDFAGNLICTGENIAPLVYITNNIGDVFVSKINAGTGAVIWDAVYNNTSNEKELVYSLAIDFLNNILIGGNENLQDVTAVHNNGYARLYSTNGTLISSITKPAFELVFRVGFLNNGHAILRSSTASNLYLTEYNATPTLQSSKTINFTNGVGWTAMDIAPNNDIALAVSDVTCANRGVNILYISKNPLSTENLLKEEIIHIYPNPCSTSLTVRTSFSGNGKLEIFNSVGHLVISQNASNMNLQTIGLANLSNGIYFLKVKTTEGDFSRKFVKE